MAVPLWSPLGLPRGSGARTRPRARAALPHGSAVGPAAPLTTRRRAGPGSHRRPMMLHAPRTLVPRPRAEVRRCRRRWGRRRRLRLRRRRRSSLRQCRRRWRRRRHRRTPRCHRVRRRRRQRPHGRRHRRGRRRHRRYGRGRPCPSRPWSPLGTSCSPSSAALASVAWQPRLTRPPPAARGRERRASGRTAPSGAPRSPDEFDGATGGKPPRPCMQPLATATAPPALGPTPLPRPQAALSLPAIMLALR